NQKDFLMAVKNSHETPKTSCPSPDAYLQEMKGEEEVFVVTLSANLSGSHNSAEIAKKMYIEKYGNKNIEVINSCSASVRQTLIAKKLLEYIQERINFKEIVKQIKTFRDGLKTKFVLDDLDTLRKNGRPTKVQSLLV